jgi:hypothetical protein
LISWNLFDKENPANDNIKKLFEQHYGSIDESKFERLFTQYNINRVKKKPCRLIYDKNKRDWFYWFIDGNWFICFNFF